MSTSSFFGDIMQTIAERGRRLLAPGPPAGTRTSRDGDVVGLCETLLSSRGEASGMALAREVLDRWAGLDAAGQHAFMMALLTRFGPDEARLATAVDAYRAAPSPDAAGRLHAAAEPRRQELIRRLNLAPNGTASLVAMREALIVMKAGEPALEAVDADFAHLFGSWFNRGFLVLRRIDWSTPAGILEKVIRYEAVHEIRDWDELRRRLAPEDRRCFAFFHPQLPDEPLIFVEVALTRETPKAIADVLDGGRRAIRAGDATTAVFYSISNCQEGLKGISFGSFLIKQVVEDLSRELPTLQDFVTLSPAPGFAAWLARERRADASEVLSEADREALAFLDAPDWPDDAAAAAAVEAALMPAAAAYFLVARAESGRPVDPVARFHLGNGARLERLDFLGDRSARAMRQACGLMVNYRYKLEDIEANHEAYAVRREVVAAPAVRKLLRVEKPAKSLVPVEEGTAKRRKPKQDAA